MPFARKIDFPTLNRLVAEGMTTSELADYFEVSRPAISYWKKKLDKSIIRAHQITRATEAVSKHLRVVDQLEKINKDAHKILQDAMEECNHNGEPKFIGTGAKDPRDIAIKAMRRIEAQLRLQNDTLSLLADMQATLEFQQQLVELMNDIDPALKEEFLRRAKDRRALRAIVESA